MQYTRNNWYSIVPLIMVGLWSFIIYSETGPVLDLPTRSSELKSADTLYNEWLPLTRAQREQRLLTEIRAGNVPNTFRNFRPVELKDPDNPSIVRGTMYVTSDYLAVGTDSASLRMPVSAPLAQLIADELGCYLPTRHVVNLIDRAATARPQSPSTFNPSVYTITSLEVFRLSHNAIDAQLPPVDRRGIVSGIKKDIVITNQLTQRPPPPRVAIFGWHYSNGTPIQNLSLVHGEMYMDYSHGLRLVWPKVTIDGEERDYMEVLQSPTLHRLLSDEGALTVTRYPTSNWP